MAQVFNPSYSGGRDQEDRSSKPDWPNSYQDPISKIPNTKTVVGGVAQVVEDLSSKCETLSSNPSIAKNKQTNNQTKKTPPHLEVLYK
jgi:hypothetical protein